MRQLLLLSLFVLGNSQAIDIQDIEWLPKLDYSLTLQGPFEHEIYYTYRTQFNQNTQQMELVEDGLFFYKEPYVVPEMIDHQGSSLKGIYISYLRNKVNQNQPFYDLEMFNAAVEAGNLPSLLSKKHTTQNNTAPTTNITNNTQQDNNNCDIEVDIGEQDILKTIKENNAKRANEFNSINQEKQTRLAKLTTQIKQAPLLVDHIVESSDDTIYILLEPTCPYCAKLANWLEANQEALTSNIVILPFKYIRTDNNINRLTDLFEIAILLSFYDENIDKLDFIYNDELQQTSIIHTAQLLADLQTWIDEDKGSVDDFILEVFGEKGKILIDYQMDFTQVIMPQLAWFSDDKKSLATPFIIIESQGKYQELLGIPTENSLVDLFISK